MANFCSSCGAKIGARDKFCPSCGSPASVKASTSAVGHWEAKEINTDEAGSSRKGTLSLSKDYLIFYSYGFFSGKAKEWRRIPIVKIKSVTRSPIFKMVTFKYNKAPSGAGGFRRFFSKRVISFRIKDWQSLIENIRRLNPNIKIKC